VLDPPQFPVKGRIIHLDAPPAAPAAPVATPAPAVTLAATGAGIDPSQTP